MQLHPALLLALHLFLLGLPVNTGKSVHSVHRMWHVGTWQCPYLQWHLDRPLEMPGSLPSLHGICGVLVARRSHLKMYTWELELRTLVMATLSKRQRCTTFFPGAAGTLIDMTEKRNPVIQTSLTLWAQGKSINPTTHLPQDTHLPLHCTTFRLCYLLSCHCKLHCHYRQYSGWKLVSQSLSLHQEHQDSLY